jgi:prepilin-type N-terminal cleavage/methylation domain-containing protein
MNRTHLAAGPAAAHNRCARGNRAAKSRSAFTLLEVILALAILVGALAVLGELADQGLTNARSAATLAEAQLLCESKMAEVAAGIVPASTVSGATLETDPAWSYSIIAEPTLDEGLIAVRVTVYETLPAEKRPTEYALVRWMIDPTYAAEAAASTETAP